MKRYLILALVIFAASLVSCSKPLVSASVKGDIGYLSRDFAATPNNVYYAIRWALQERRYPIANEDLQGGILTSAWVPTKSDSHYIEMFGKPDMGVTNSYYQLEVQVIPQGSRTEVKVGTRIKSVVSTLKSTGFEERKILSSIGDNLRKSEPDISNLGIEE